MTKRKRKQPEILEHHGENRKIFVIVVLFDVHSVEQDFALGGVIKTAEQLDKRGFAAAVHAYNRKLFPYLELQVHMAEGICFRVRVFERNVAELDIVFVVIALFHRKSALIHGVWNVEIREKALEIAVVDKRKLKRAHNAGNCGEQQHNAGNVLRD